MSAGNGSVAGQVLSEIETRLAAIPEDGFAVPPSKRRDGMHIATVANDHIKRLFTLRMQLNDEGDAIARQGKRLADSALADIAKKGAAAVAKELLTEGSPALQVRAQLEELRAKTEKISSFASIVDAIFWEEVNRQHPDLESHSLISISSDWSLCWGEEEDEEAGIEGARIRIISVSSADGIAEFLGHRGR